MPFKVKYPEHLEKISQQEYPYGVMDNRNFTILSVFKTLKEADEFIKKKKIKQLSVMTN
ncbi:MAG: hypothetical protein ACE5J9_05285 [Methanosarcinales archaeon]